MKINEQVLEQLFVGTTVSTQTVRQYVRTMPAHSVAAIDAEFPPHLYTAANHIDFIEFYLKHYVGGFLRSPHRALAEVRAFWLVDEPLARQCVPLILQRVERTLLANEWYELMPRYQKAHCRIQKALSSDKL